MSAVSETSVTVAPGAKKFGWSALVSASARYWRATGILLLIIVVNAALQAVLVSFEVIPFLNSVTFWVLALVSLAILIVAALLMATAALETAAGRISIRETIARATPNLGRFTLWILLWALLVLLGVSLYTWPGLVILAITPYLPLAAADGHRNPFKANFQAIASRFGHYLEVVVFSCIILGVARLLGALFNLLIFGAWASFVTMFVSGLIASWLAVAWALVYRSTSVGSIDRGAVDHGTDD